MKTLPLVACAAALGMGLALLSPVSAAPNLGPDGHAAHAHHKPGRVKKLAEALHLSKAQENRLQPQIMANAREADRIHHDRSLTRGQQKRALLDLHRENAGQVRAVLNKDQHNRLRALQADARKDHHDYKHDHHDDHHGDKHDPHDHH